MESKLNFGLIISELFKSRKISKTEASKLLGYTLPGLSKILEKTDVSTEVLKKVCQALNIEMGDLLNVGTYVSHSGNMKVAGDGNNFQFGKNHNVESVKVTDSELLLVKNENAGLKREIEGYKEQIKLLKEMVEILKGRA